MMTVSAAGIAYVWTGGIQSGVQEGTTEEAESIQTQASTCMIVENVAGRKVYLRNCGSGVITANALLTYIDGLPANGTLTGSISPNTVGTLVLNGIWNLSLGNHKIRVTNGIADITKNVVAEVRKDGLVGYWKFDEGCGTTTADSSSSGNGGQLKNGTAATCWNNGACPSWATGKLGNALQFDGVGDYVAITQTNFALPSAFSVAAWVKANSYQNLDYVLWRNDDRPGIRMNSNKWWFGVDGNYGNAFSSTSDIQTGTWTHLALSFTGSVGKGYINGIEEVSRNDATYAQGTTLRIGWDGATGRQFDGIIDEVRIYNKALSPDDMMSLKAV